MMKLFYLRRKEFSNVLMFNLFFLPEEEIFFVFHELFIHYEFPTS